jgi:2-C-methyl-D-erythritol 4-phosphate cytidylyltransferase
MADPMVVAIIFAGGRGVRMSSRALPKQFLEVHGRPIIVHTLEHFEEHPDVDAVAVAILPEYRDHLARLLHRYELSKVRWVVDGGKTGQESRHAALSAVAAECPADSVVMVHDGVRPLINAELISENIDSVREYGSAITCTKFSETMVSSSTHDIDAVIPRENIYTAQAPQSFRLGEILELHDRAKEDGEFDVVDSCSLMLRYGRPVRRVDGPRANIKITTAEDFYICRAFFEQIENRQVAGL